VTCENERMLVKNKLSRIVNLLSIYILVFVAKKGNIPKLNQAKY
jgi:hypothetical protein